MTDIQLFSLVLLVVILVVAIWRRINIGLLGLAGAALIPVFSDITVKQLFNNFPGSIFTLLLGVSMLFSHFQRSGGLLFIIKRIYNVVGERTSLIPWTGFIIGAVISTAGAFSPAPIALLVPIIAAISRRSPKLFFISEMAVIVGANVAGTSPLNPTGSVINAAATNAGINYQPWLVWGVCMIMAVIFVFILQMLFQSKNMYDQESEASSANSKKRFLLISPLGGDKDEDLPLQPVYALISGFAVFVFVCLVVFMRADVGLTAISLAILLTIIYPKDSAYHMSKVPWSAIIVLCGLLLYVESMHQLGTMTAIEQTLTGLTSNPFVLVLIIAYLTAFLSNIESSTLGVLALMSPMLFNVMGHSDDISLLVAAVVGPAALSVVNPIHAAGTLIIAYTKEEQQNALFKRSLIISGLTVLFVPIIATLPPLLYIF